MSTVNISLPVLLRSEADQLVSLGKYTSFSDLVRTAIRQLVSRDKYDLWASQAKQDLRKGKAAVLKSSADVNDFIDSLK